MSEQGSVKGWLLHPRGSVAHDRLVIRYAGGIVVLWCGLAVAGLVYGFAAVGAERTEAGCIGLGLAAICTFVAWFAARPALVADRTGLAVHPIFGGRTVLRWDEVRSIGVREVRAARGRGPALVVEASDDREVKIDSLWVGATKANLQRMEEQLQRFTAALDIATPRFVPDPAAADTW